MSPENKALVERVRDADGRAVSCKRCEGRGWFLDTTYDRTGAEMFCGKCEGTGLELAPAHIKTLRTAAPQLATALEAAEKRADAAEAKLKVAREALDVAKHVMSALQQARGDSLTHYPLMAKRLIDEHIDPALAQLNPEESKQ